MTALAELGLGTLFAGNAGLLQLTVLPGLLAHEWQTRTRWRVPAIDSLLFIFVASAVASFLAVLLLQSLGLHKSLAWQGLGWAQVLTALWLGFTNHRSRRSLATGQRLPLLAILGLLVYLFCLIELVRTLIGHWPGVLEGWDAIVSWNRWARDWTAGRWPELTWGYPQLVPALWSVLYLWQGSSEIEVFVRMWMGLFAVALLLVFLAAYVHWRRWPLLLAGAVVCGIVMIPYRHVLDSGYVDLPLALAIALTAHWSLLAISDKERAPCWLVFATVATALALLIKQGGVLALLMWLWALWQLRGHRLLVLQCIGLLLLFVLPWYGLAWWHGGDDSVVAYVTHDIYGAESLRSRLVRALTQTLPAVVGVGGSPKLASVIVFIALIGLVLAMRDRNGRFCCLSGFAALLGWALFFSYDGRNLLPALPLILMGLAHGYGRLQGAPPWLSDSLPIIPVSPSRPLYRVIPVLTLLVLLGTALPADIPRWERLTDRLRQFEGDPQLNRQLLALVQQPEFTGQIYTTYPQVPALRELRPHWFDDHGASHMQPLTSAALQRGAPLCEVFTTIAGHERIAYVLLHDSIYPGMVNAALAQGTLQTVLTAPGLKLMRVQCTEPAP